MQLTILGGGGFRVPLIHRALLADDTAGAVSDLVLYDLDPGRLAVIEGVLRQQPPSHRRDLRVRTSTDLDEALRGADVVFCAVRVGGLHGRTQDERVALDLGLLGQETVGPGGLAYAVRTLPVALDIAERVARLAPTAWLINFTNPAGVITQAMQTVLGERAIGICDSPVGLIRRATHAAAIVTGAPPERITAAYSGLNHLGWLDSLTLEGRDVLPELLADPGALATFEEGRLFGAEWLQSLQAIPNEYLYYYDFTREAIASLRGAGQTRGEFLLAQQESFYAGQATWEATRRSREETYLREARDAEDDRDELDISGGGYDGVALALMSALTGDRPSTLILNVRNASGPRHPSGEAPCVLPGLPAQAVVEVACHVDRHGPVPLPAPALRGERLGLAQQIKAVEELTMEAVAHGSRPALVRAFAHHPLVDSVTSARTLIQGYSERIPEFAQALRGVRGR